MIHAPATLADVDELVLREEDAREVSEGWRELVRGVVADWSAETYRGSDGALLGIFGLTRPAPGQLSPWLLCSAEAARYPREVLSVAKQWTRRLQYAADGGVFVFNHIPKDSVRNRAFVQHLGFRIVQDDVEDLFYLPAHV